MTDGMRKFVVVVSSFVSFVDSSLIRNIITSFLGNICKEWPTHQKRGFGRTQTLKLFLLKIKFTHSKIKFTYIEEGKSPSVKFFFFLSSSILTCHIRRTHVVIISFLSTPLTSFATLF